MSDFTDAVPGIHWYVVHTYSGYENKVKQNLEKLIENRNLYEDFVDIQIPVEKRIEGEKEIESKLFPSYVFVKMQMNDANWHVVRNITGVTGFVGPGSKPVPLSEEEAMRMGVEIVQAITLTYSVGDSIKIISGPLTGFLGVVQSISEDNKKVSVLASMFGRETTVELDSDQIELAQ